MSNIDDTVCTERFVACNSFVIDNNLFLCVFVIKFCLMVLIKEVLNSIFPKLIQPKQNIFLFIHTQFALI